MDSDLVFKKSTDTNRLELEAWVVNTVKINLLTKLESRLEGNGLNNLRKLVLVPIFEVDKMFQRIELMAPELKTIFFKELTDTLKVAEKKFG
jgi:hypothetical protein